jgi:RNA recognition motif-containing protein
LIKAGNDKWDEQRANNLKAERARAHIKFEEVSEKIAQDDAALAEGRRLYLGNLAYSATEEEVQKFFEGYSMYNSLFFPSPLFHPCS